MKRTALLLLLLTLRYGAQAAVDFTAAESIREQDGITFPELIFHQDGHKITYEAPRGWSHSGGGSEIRFTPPALSQAQATIDKLAARAGAFAGGGAPKAVTIAGVAAKELSIGGRFSIFYAAFDGKLVITSAQTGISGLKDSGPRLGDDATFKDATSAAGMPDATSGFVYLNLKDSIPLLESVAKLGGQTIPTTASGNLAPLHAFVAYGKSEGSETSFTAFLQVK